MNAAFQALRHSQSFGCQPSLALATTMSALRALVVGTTTFISPHDLSLVSAYSGNWLTESESTVLALPKHERERMRP